MPLPLIPIALQLAGMVGPKLVEMVAGGKAGKVAGEVAAIAKTVTGATSPEEALATLQTSDEFRQEFRMAVLEQEEKLEWLYLEDRQDARKRDVELRRVQGSNYRGDVLAFAAIAGLIVLTWSMVFVEIPDGPARDVLLLLSGALITVVKDVYAFEFGSSRGSKDKDKLLSGQ